MRLSTFKQIIAVSQVSLLGVPRRLGACSVIVVGIAGVVAVLICVFAMAEGFATTMNKTGRMDRVIVLSRGAEAEAGSTLSREAVANILSRGEIEVTAQGKSVACPEALAFARLTDRRTQLDAFATIRGTGPALRFLRPEIRMIEGRMFTPGLHEVIVGRTLQRRLEGLTVGEELPLPKGSWVIVGIFDSNGDSHESEILADAETLLSAYERNQFNSLTLKLATPTEFDSLRAELLTDPKLAVEVRREHDYLAEAAKPTVQLLRIMATFIGGVMSLGAVFAAVNAMYSAIASRAMEISTLRAIGYGGTPVVVSVFIEALVFATVGAATGALLARVFFNGNVISTLSGAAPAPLTYVLHVGAEQMYLGMGCACVIGVLGGLFPAIRVARGSVAVALRGTY